MGRRRRARPGRHRRRGVGPLLAALMLAAAAYFAFVVLRGTPLYEPPPVEPSTPSSTPPAQRQWPCELGWTLYTDGPRYACVRVTPRP